MNIQELDKYNLEDAVKFHDHLNPRLWGRDEHLLPEVQEKLRAIAADFQEFLGVPDLKLRDITISGSNAAYSYTPASDIDLHLVVDMPQDPVYQELFNAKKYQYNDQYDIRIGGADVELYVQPADQVHTSQGIYSILNQDWVSVPSRKRAHIDHSCVQAKTADLEQRILDAVKSQDSKRLDAIAQKIKTMRKAGLDAHGEFSCENLVFKMLRRSGALEKLKQARSDAHDRELSLMEKNKKKKRWSYNGYWNPGFGYAGQESGSDHVDQTASGDGLAEDQNFVVQFSAFRPNGERINKKFRVKAADKYVASDKIKEKFGAEYDTFTHPVFKFGKTDRGIASDYVASLARGLREQGVAEGFPQPGESSGKAKQFNPNAKIQSKEMTLDQVLNTVKGIPYVNNVIDDWDAKDYSWGVTKKVIEYAQYLKKNPQSVANLPPLVVIDGQLNDGAHRLSAINLLQKRMDPKNPLWKQVKLKVNFGTSADVASTQGVAEGSGNNTTAQKIFFARSNKAPKGWSYDHVGFITQDGKQIQMSGHKGNEVYVTNAVTDDPEFPKQKIKIVSLSKPVSVPTTNSVGAENCGTFVANVLQANGIKGIDTQKLYSVMKEPLKQDVAEGSGFDQDAGIGIDGQSFKFKIRDLVDLAKNYPVTKVDPKQFSDQIAGREEDPAQSAARAEQADLQYPIIVVKRANGQLWIADGTHRAHKAILNKLPSINAKIIPIKDMAPFSTKQGVAEDLGDHKKIRKAAQDFYQNSVGDVDTSKVDGYVDKANELLQKTDPSLRSRVKNILQRARKNPSIQGSVITAVGAILAGGVITSAQRYGLSPLQTNLLLQGVLNSVIPVMVKRVTGANWLDTLKYTLSSVLTGTGIAATTTMGEASTPDGVSPSTRMFLSETELTNTIREFIDRVCDRLKIEKHPDVEFHLDSDWSSQNKTFGRFDPDTCTLHVSLTDRHPMDIMRTVAHELVHCRQNELEKLPLDAGETGSRWENQANAIAGVIMRDMAQDRPEYFQDQMTTEDADDVDNMKWPGKPLNFPKGTVKVGVSDVYDWYKLGQQISDLDDADPRDFGKGAPETVLSFGSEPIEHKYIKDLKRLGMPTTDIDESASGYIPTRKQARDPRFSMALTQDIKPGEVGRQANKLKLKTTSKGEPQLLYKGLQNALEQFKATGEYLKESEQIEEIRMNPQSLRAEAEKIPALAGMEFEMIIPNITVDDEDLESEPDWDADERITSTDSIRNFFISDYNTRREVDRVIDGLWEDYLSSDWLDEKKQEEWGDSVISAVEDWVRENESDELEDKAKEEIAAGTPDFGVGTEEYKKLVDDRYEKLVEARAEEITSNGGEEYDEAYEQWEENDWSELWNDDDWVTDWLDNEGITHMSSIQDLSWPQWTTPESNDIDLESVASSFQDEVAGNRSVRYAAKYHGLDRDRTTWIIEPDGSLNPGEGDSGLEFVSPPLSIKEMIDTLNQVYAWAKASDAYTNRSTGLHINVSVEGFAEEKLDYVKLALLLGDEYVLNQFGRIANTYTRSAFQKIKNKLLDTPEKITQYFDLMRQGLSKTASEMIHAPSTEKFTSINVKTGYIEFRSPGGDWLNKNPQEIENTLLRFVVALDAALDPNKYRQEYLKKLYKILAPRSDQDAIAIFARYSAGELPQTALRSFIKQIQLQRKISKEKDLPVKKYVWDVRRNGPDSDGPGMEVASTSSQEALEIAAREWNLSPAERARVSVKPLRPVDQPEPA